MPNKYESLLQEFEGTGITVMKDGHLVSRKSDWIMYSVPAEFIDSVVATYGPCKRLLSSTLTALTSGSSFGCQLFFIYTQYSFGCHAD